MNKNNNLLEEVTAVTASLDRRLILTGNSRGMIKITNTAPLFEGPKDIPSNPLTNIEVGERGWAGLDERKDIYFLLISEI